MTGQWSLGPVFGEFRPKVFSSKLASEIIQTISQSDEYRTGLRIVTDRVFGVFQFRLLIVFIRSYLQSQKNNPLIHGGNYEPDEPQRR